MIITFVIVGVCLLVFLGDCSCLKEMGLTKRRFRQLACIAAAVDFFPYLLMPLSFLLVRDNTQPWCDFTMMLITLYFYLTLPRIAFYLMRFLVPWKRIGKWLGGVLAILVFTTLIYGTVKTRNDLEVKNVNISFENLPHSFDGYRIALFSDLHVGAMTDPVSQTERVVSEIEKLDADLVVFSGDLVNIRYSELDERVVSALSRLKGRDGMVFVEGNHDTGIYIKDTVSLPCRTNCDSILCRMRRAGWTQLRDSTLFIRRGADSLSVTGIGFTQRLLTLKHSFASTDDYEAAPLYEGVPQGVFNITVSHMPQIWQSLLAAGRADLTLSGHVHATQIKFPVGERGISPAQILYSRWSGLYRNGDSKAIYINDGIGSVGFYFRLGARPEITLLSLARAQ